VNTMSATEPSLVSLMILGGLGSVIGYLVRISMKFEDRRDEINLKFLPSLNYGISSFMEAKEIFLFDSQLQPFVDKIKDINKKLEEQIFSGEMLFFDENFRNTLLDFSRNLRKFQSTLEQTKGSEGINETVKYVFEKGEIFGDTDINPNKLLNDAKAIQDEIEYKIRSFNSYLYYLILAFLLGMAIAVFEYFKT